jgi:hypothetical protein
MKRTLLFAIAPLAAGLLAGCSQAIGIEGYAVSASNQPGIVMLDERPLTEPARIVDDVRVELWTGDGERLLNRPRPSDGWFSAGYVGSLAPSGRYLIRARAPGYRTLSRKVTLQPGTNWARIEMIASPGSP